MDLLPTKQADPASVITTVVEKKPRSMDVSAEFAGIFGETANPTDMPTIEIESLEDESALFPEMTESIDEGDVSSRLKAGSVNSGTGEEDGLSSINLKEEHSKVPQDHKALSVPVLNAVGSANSNSEAPVLGTETLRQEMAAKELTGSTGRLVEQKVMQSSMTLGGAVVVTQRSSKTALTDEQKIKHDDSVISKDLNRLDGPKSGGETALGQMTRSPKSSLRGLVQSPSLVTPTFSLVDSSPFLADAELQGSTMDQGMGRLSDAKIMITPASPNDLSVATARLVAPQVSYAVQQTPNGMIEVALSPEELGKVRMTMQSVDNNISVIVFAERPETGDLMRRHIEILTQDLRNLGYESVNLSFGKHGDSATPHPRDGTVHSHNDSDKEATDTTVSLDVYVQPSDGLDLRL